MPTTPRQECYPVNNVRCRVERSQRALPRRRLAGASTTERSQHRIPRSAYVAQVKSGESAGRWLPQLHAGRTKARLLLAGWCPPDLSSSSSVRVASGRLWHPREQQQAAAQRGRQRTLRFAIHAHSHARTLCLSREPLAWRRCCSQPTGTQMGSRWVARSSDRSLDHEFARVRFSDLTTRDLRLSIRSDPPQPRVLAKETAPTTLASLRSAHEIASHDRNAHTSHAAPTGR